MGSHIELNDTLQITSEQGFPENVLNFEKHRYWGKNKFSQKIHR